MIVPPRQQAPAERIAFASGLMRAHIVDGVPLDRLAADYGMSLPLLRDRLAGYVATCTAALEQPKTEAVVPPPPPAPAPLVPPAPRVRERIRLAPAATAVADTFPKRGMAGVAVRQRKAADHDAVLRPIIADVRAAGAVTHSEIARVLNSRGVPTLRGAKWSATQVRRVQDRTTLGGSPCQ